MTKEFVCDDGSGTIFLYLEVVADASGTNGTWQIAGGDGAYADLGGGGTIVGEPVEPEGRIIDHYSGKLYLSVAQSSASSQQH